MYLNYIHYFRAIAIIFIVASHVIGVFVWSGTPELVKILRIFIQNGSTLFVFIAGYLFQHLSKKYETRKYYSSKLKNVIAPYVIVSIPAIFIFVFFLQQNNVWEGLYDKPIGVQIVYFFLTGTHLGPLWFIPMIAIIYILAPILIKADKDGRIYYLLPIFIILTCLVHRGWQGNPPQNFVHFFSYYLLGMFCSHYKEIINPIVKKNVYLIIFAFLVLLLGFLEYYYMEHTMTFFNSLQKIFLSLLLLGTLLKYNEKLTSRFVSYIADTSFGIYFIHAYCITASKLSYQHFFGELPNGNLLTYIIFSATILLICVAIIYAVKTVVGRNSRYLVGS